MNTCSPFIKNKVFMTKLIIILFIAFSACTKPGFQGAENDIIHIRNNNDLIMKNNIEYKFIPLETTENCLLSGIRNIQIHNGKIFILDNKLSKVMVFDITGKFITQIGTLGEGPDEYNQICSFWIDQKTQTITLADRGGAKLLYYKLNDFSLILTKKSDHFEECALLANGNIAWVKSSGYDTDQRNTFYIKITDSLLNEKKYLVPADFAIEGNISSGNIFYEFNKELFLNLPFMGVVYHITSESAERHFKLDFGAHKFATLTWLKGNASKNYANAILPTDYISTCNIKETDDYISACFLVKGMNPYIGFYNKHSRKSCKYKWDEFMKLSGLNGFGLIRGTYQNYFIADISPEIVKKYSIWQQDLQEIAKNINEEDNPILCLFKPK